MWPFTSGYKVLSAAKLKQRANALSAAPKFNPDEHGVFLKATASEIVSRIESREWTASQVVNAYIARAASAHETTNCVTEVLFVEARQQALELDAEFASTGKLRGPLHGVPLSVKDPYHIAVSATKLFLYFSAQSSALDSSMGYSRLIQKPAGRDADSVALLKAAGAIPIVKRTSRQTFSFECSNPVFGRTDNPYNTAFTSGGSSGGEGALLAMDGAALGLGSDIGGSLRIPAAYCGIYSLKPGPLRVSASSVLLALWGGSVNNLEPVTFGIPGRSLGLVPILYRELKLPEKLRFGYYTGRQIRKLYSLGSKSVREYLPWIKRRNVYNTKFHEEVWVKHSLDGIIAPVQLMLQLPNL
ncbi:amidase signature domain-containing protein [Mycena filopes]|nr:amidase signature domain-containing protein [Mycena filopes]